MSAVTELVEKLIAAGMPAAEAAGLVARAGAEMSAPRRSKGAIRTERWRQNKASQIVTNRHGETLDHPQDGASQNVTERHKASQGDEATYIYSSKSPDIESKKKTDSSPRERASRLPPDWQPSEADVAYATGKGISPDRVPIVAEKFRNHWLSKSGKGATSPNWSLRWHTWVINEIEWNGGAHGRTHQARTDSAAGHAAARPDPIMAGMANLARRRREGRAAAGPGDGTLPFGDDAAEIIDAEPIRTGGH